MKTQVKKLKFGRVMATRLIASEINKDADFRKFIMQILDKHQNCDWGDLCEDDIKQNDFSKDNQGRILSSYNLPEKTQGEEKVWIITEWDRSYTTILFPSEY